MSSAPTTKSPHRPAERARRIHIPVLDAHEPGDLQRRNINAARRRVDNAFRKLYEAQLMLADVPEDIVEQALVAQAHVRAAVRAAQAAKNELSPRHVPPMPPTAPLEPSPSPARRPGRPRKAPLAASPSPAPGAPAAGIAEAS